MQLDLQRLETASGLLSHPWLGSRREAPQNSSRLQLKGSAVGWVGAGSLWNAEGFGSMVICFCFSPERLGERALPQGSWFA